MIMIAAMLVYGTELTVMMARVMVIRVSDLGCKAREDDSADDREAGEAAKTGAIYCNHNTEPPK